MQRERLVFCMAILLCVLVLPFHAASFSKGHAFSSAASPIAAWSPPRAAFAAAPRLTQVAYVRRGRVYRRRPVVIAPAWRRPVIVAPVRRYPYRRPVPYRCGPAYGYRC